MGRYKTWKGDRVIDHADNNPYNATKYNLSVMSRSMNSSKGSITEKVKLPVQMCTAYVGNEYRVQVCWETIKCNLSSEIGTAKMRFICATAEDFVDCLKQLVTISPGRTLKGFSLLSFCGNQGILYRPNALTFRPKSIKIGRKKDGWTKGAFHESV